MIDYLKNAFKNLFRKRLRSILTVTGIAIGVMSVVVISMIGDIGKSAVNSELSSMGIGGIMVSTDAQKTNAVMDTQQLELVKSNEDVKNATPLMTAYSDVRMKKERSSCVIWGIDQDTSSIISMELLYGRMINRADVNALNKVCVVDESYAQKIYKRSNIVGKSLEILMNGKYETFEIVGVAKAGGNILQNLMGNIVPCFTYVPYTTMQSLSLKTGFTQIVVQTADGADTQALSTAITAEIEEDSGISGIVVEDLNSQMDRLNRVLNMITMILTVIAGISLLVAGLSIMTVMLVSVSERTREIGIKKSIGASRKIILLEFLSESFLITFTGAVLGALGGVLIGVSGCLMLGISPIINLPTIAFAICFAVITGMLFGVYPAFKAANLKPVDALRYE